MTSRVVRCAVIAGGLVLAAAHAWAQAPALNVDSPGEADKIRENCGAVRKIVGCATELATGQPFHVAVGSLAPQNGFAGGLAWVGHKTTDNWRMNFNADGVASGQGWRAGLYVKLVNSSQGPIGFHFGTGGAPARNPTELPEHTVVGAYVQTISLDKVGYFGLGPLTSVADGTFFGLRETIGGLSAAKPFTSAIHPTVYAVLNGRFVTTHAPAGRPDLADARNFLEFGEGLRIRPVIATDLLRLNYDLSFHDYLAPHNSTYSFERLTVDLSHDLAIYRHTTRVLYGPDDNGPDECATGANPAHPDDCEAVTRDLEGRVGLRVFLSESFAASGHIIPFYLQPTLGGADINGETTLGGFQDYRFRAPNVLLVRATFEHSLFGPIGGTVFLDQAKAALTRAGLTSNAWIHSVSMGLTLRVGGIPAMSFLYSRTHAEGSHTSFLVSTSLLGGSARPSLF